MIQGCSIIFGMGSCQYSYSKFSLQEWWKKWCNCGWTWCQEGDTGAKFGEYRKWILILIELRLDTHHFSSAFVALSMHGARNHLCQPSRLGRCWFVEKQMLISFDLGKMQIKSLRLPMKFGNHRGFAFVEHVTKQETQNALFSSTAPICMVDTW